MALPTFRVVSAETKNQGETELVRVAYEFGKSDALDRAWVEFEPKRTWAIRAAEVRTALSRWRDVLRYDIEYAPSSVIAPPAPRRVRFTDRKGEVTVCDFTTFEWAPTPEAAFSMTAYGLPDLTHPTPAGTSYLVWLLLIASISLLLAYFLSRISRPSRSPA